MYKKVAAFSHFFSFEQLILRLSEAD